MRVAFDLGSIWISRCREVDYHGVLVRPFAVVLDVHFSLSSRLLQLGDAHTTEIKHNIREKYNFPKTWRRSKTVVYISVL